MHALALVSIIVAPLMIGAAAGVSIWRYCYNKARDDNGSVPVPVVIVDTALPTIPTSTDTESLSPKRPRKGSLASKWKSVELDYIVTTSAETAATDVGVDTAI